MAVRTANFISSFLQVVNPNEVFPGTRIVDKPLNEDQMIGEALAIVMGNTKVWSAGIYFDANQFTNRSYFAPFAYNKEFNTRKFEVEDLARLNTSNNICTPTSPGSSRSSPDGETSMTTWRSTGSRCSSDPEVEEEISPSLVTVSMMTSTSDAMNTSPSITGKSEAQLYGR